MSALVTTEAVNAGYSAYMDLHQDSLDPMLVTKIIEAAVESHRTEGRDALVFEIAKSIAASHHAMYAQPTHTATFDWKVYVWWAETIVKLLVGER